MSAARARHSDHRPAREPARRPVRALPGRQVASDIGGRIRWDRVSRVGLLVVLVGIVGLYVGPARSYFATVNEAKARSAAVQKLKAENRRLRARSAELNSAGYLERKARELGMVRPGESAYVIRGLPKGP